MTALYFAILRPGDRVAVKPHASPAFHAIQYLFGRQTRENLERFRAFGGAQAYPSRTKDEDDVDFSTGSVGLGVAATLFASIVRDYIRSHEWEPRGGPDGRMIALAGDAELDEGNIFEALLEGWKHEVRNLWWIVDYNRQSLDSVITDRLYGRFDDLFRNMGWRVETLKYGKELQRVFRRRGGDALRKWIDDCPNTLYSAMVFKGGAAWRERLTEDIGKVAGMRAILDEFDDDRLARLMTNLAGHDIEAVVEAFEAAADSDQPTCFIAYTIKGYGLPFAGHKDNHAGLMSVEQMDELRRRHRVERGAEWDRFAGLALPSRGAGGVHRGGALRRGRESPLRGPRGDRSRGVSRSQGGAVLHPGVLRPDPRLHRTGAERVRGPGGHHLPGRDRLHQSRRVGQPAGGVLLPGAGRHLSRGGGRLVPGVGRLAAGAAHRARHRGEQPVHPARDARALGLPLRAAAAPRRHPVRPLHPARPRRPQLRLLPGRPVPPRRHPVRDQPCPRRRGPPVHLHPAHRHGPGPARRLRAGVRRRAGRHHALGVRLHAARAAGRGGAGIGIGASIGAGSSRRRKGAARCTFA